MSNPTTNQTSSTSADNAKLSVAKGTDTGPNDTPGGQLSAAPSESPKKTNMIVGLAIAVIIIAIISALVGHMWSKSNSKSSVGTTANRVVKLGLIAPLTGDDANYGQVMQHGVELAQGDFNHPGLSFQILVRDTQCQSAQAVAATKELVNDGVIAIIGDTCSGSTEAAIPVAASKHVVILSPSASSPLLTGISPYFWRDYPTDSHQAVSATKLMYQRGIRRLAIMHSTEAYGAGLDTVATADFKALGGTIVADESFQTTDVNFRAQLNAVQAAKPDAIYLMTNGEAAGAAVVVEARQMMGLKNVPLYGSDALKETSFLADIGTAGDGMSLITPTAGDQAFLDEYKAAYGADPANATGAQSYDAFMALAGIIKNGAMTGDAIRQALPGVHFQGVSGEIKFDSKHDLAGGAYLLYTIKNGQFVFDRSI